ncbi:MULTISPECIES: Z1 domain-containing protein [Streptacidiphilus]|uniref:Z1 domain-containing protein n=1 Tax=Streptacidiphilus cavernicola TaxID=3342716 RepID=A0ABV6UFP5_9ACTN|nr:Z1 domain-containing protein [Streptacidiphilus jeojiense]
MSDPLLDVHTTTLAVMKQSPRPFAKWASGVAEEDHPNIDLSEAMFVDRIGRSGTEGDPLVALWSRTLTAWDFAEAAAWAQGTPARSAARRACAYDVLGFDEALRAALDDAVPVSPLPGATVITDDSRGYVPWYTPGRAAARSFYWKAYEAKLRAKGWSDSAIASLDEASRAVVERLADPEHPEPRQAKGLVVGYVQSGKTANFTGVAAKAIDAGYRLVIVLGGTLNMLRSQTQRRIDMELVGQENILRDADPQDLDTLVGIDYVGEDGEWSEFVRHGGRPSQLGAFDIERLTGRDNDYKSLDKGIGTLEIQKLKRSLPLYDPENLHRAAARVMVVKKNKAVLSKLVKDLKQVRSVLGELPTLIIDDESDQASVNTKDPRKSASKEAIERTAINGLISQLLGLLPRAQYVGYTATPFANVFIDPGDVEDLFPSDFLISLPRPEGYMGVQDFHDLDSALPESERTPANSQQAAHVRSICDGDDDRLQEAVDAFVLTGAVKLYRADRDVDQRSYRHHTMLVHESVKKDDHAELQFRVSALWNNSGYSSARGHARLAKLWEDDIRKVSLARAADLPNPNTYEELREYVSRACQLIRKGGSPVTVVNGDSDKYFEQLDLDFDRTPNVWKILIGGAKLSRGFTIEGLTVSYYRRTTLAADTLMQMGRWFGFRPGYRDLVRLYISRAEQRTKTQTADLYEAFEAICRDEEAFRSQLDQYAELIEGQPQVTPGQVPPLIAQHMPWLPPTSRNKRFNAELVEIRSPGKPIEPAAYPSDGEVLEANAKRWDAVLRGFTRQKVEFRAPASPAGNSERTFSALTAMVGQEGLMRVLRSLEWGNPGNFLPNLRYLEQLDGTLARVDEWLVIAPQLVDGEKARAAINGSPVPFSLVRRTRQAGKSAFGRISSVEHLRLAQNLVDSAADPALALEGNPVLGRHTGVVLLYPVVEARADAEVHAAVQSDGSADLSRLVMAFTVVAPKFANDSSRRLVRFQVKDSRHKDAIVVNAEE